MKVPSAVLHRDLHTENLEVVDASGLYLTFANGKKMIDATGGAAVSCIGHGDLRVVNALAAQMKKVDYCHSMFFSCAPSEQLAQFLVNSTQGQMARALFVSSGSEAMDAALKLARQYFLEISPPQPQRMRFISRHESYHGNTLGALSVSGHKARRAIYEPMLSSTVSHVSACNIYRGCRSGETVEAYVERLALELDDEFQRVGPDTVCAFVAEPVVGAALGCVTSLPGYFKAMKAVCDRYGTLLILDEIMCGMGRTGTLHAWEQEGVVPDIQTLGKGLGGGYVPIAGLLISHRVLNALDDGTGQFVHGQTYQGHPSVCAAALEVQRVIESDGLLANAKRMGSCLELRLRSAFADHPYVGDIRGRGLFWGLEFVSDRATKEAFSPELLVAMVVYEEGVALDLGIMLYPGRGSVDGRKGDHIIIAPPYNVTEEQIELIVERCQKAVNAAFGKLSPLMST